MPGGAVRVCCSAGALPRRRSARANCPGCARRGPGCAANAGRRGAGQKRTRLRPRTRCRAPAGEHHAVAPSPRVSAGRDGAPPGAPVPRPKKNPAGSRPECRRALASRVTTCALRSLPQAEFCSRARVPQAYPQPRLHPRVRPATRQERGRDQRRPRARPGLVVRAPRPRIAERA